MGGFQHAGIGKNKKVIENSQGPESENLNNSYLLSEMASFDYDFGLE